jgi:hypothetical protein
MIAVQLRQARANLAARPECARHDGNQNDGQRDQQRFEQATHDFGML